MTTTDCIQTTTEFEAAATRARRVNSTIALDFKRNKSAAKIAHTLIEDLHVRGMELGAFAIIHMNDPESVSDVWCPVKFDGATRTFDELVAIEIEASGYLDRAEITLHRLG